MASRGQILVFIDSEPESQEEKSTAEFKITSVRQAFHSRVI